MGGRKLTEKCGTRAPGTLRARDHPSLKRYIAREVHRAITRPSPLAPRGAEIRRLRNEAGLPLRVVAEQFDTNPQRLSCVERGLTRDPDLQTRIHAWLTQPETDQIAA